MSTRENYRGSGDATIAASRTGGNVNISRDASIIRDTNNNRYEYPIATAGTPETLETPAAEGKRF
jgi:hypothetical protein